MLVGSLKSAKWGVGRESAATSLLWIPPTQASLKPIRNRLFELLAASGSFWSRLGAAGIDLGCQGMVLAAVPGSPAAVLAHRQLCSGSPTAMLAHRQLSGSCSWLISSCSGSPPAVFWLTGSYAGSLTAIWQLFWLTGNCVLAHWQLCWLTGSYLAAVPGSQQEQEPGQLPGRQNNCWKAKTAAGEPERSS